MRLWFNVGQADLMRFFDENLGKYYNVRELCVLFEGVMNRTTIAREVTKILKRDGYEAKIIKMDSASKRLTMHYGAKKENE